MSNILELNKIYKKYIVQKNSDFTLKETIINRLKNNHLEKSEILALKDISFNITEGEALGVIGHNGAGKSTLLRLICGLCKPTGGEIIVNGIAGGLLELGSGFHPDLTGRENLYTSGLLNGLSKVEIRECEDEIISFTELEEFIDFPIRTYSSGMYMRLAFTVLLSLIPDIFVIDEMLSVGDSRFKNKCYEKLLEHRDSGRTMVITSHSMDEIKLLCDRVIVLEEGKIAIDGKMDDALNVYYDLLTKRTENRLKKISKKPEFGGHDYLSKGTKEVMIKYIDFVNSNGNSSEEFLSGDNISIITKYVLNDNIEDFSISLGIYNLSKTKCFETFVPSARLLLGKLDDNGEIICKIDNIFLLPGIYYVNIGFYSADFENIFDYHEFIHKIKIVNPRQRTLESFSGIVDLDLKWSKQ